MKQLFSLLIIGSLVGCTSREPSPAPAPAVKEAVATSQPSRSDVDRDVIDFVLNDLLTSNDSPLVGRHVPPQEILLWGKPSPYPRTADQVLMRHDKKQWEALSPVHLAAATQAADLLIQRHQAGEAFPAGPPRDARVKLQTETPATQPKEHHPLADRPVHAYLPGYSTDEQFAVVALSIPWSIHHADATYFLARDGNNWRIVLRQFVYYV